MEAASTNSAFGYLNMLPLGMAHVLTAGIPLSSTSFRVSNIGDQAASINDTVVLQWNSIDLSPFLPGATEADTLQHIAIHCRRYIGCKRHTCVCDPALLAHRPTGHDHPFKMNFAIHQWKPADCCVEITVPVGQIHQRQIRDVELVDTCVLSKTTAGRKLDVSCLFAANLRLPASNQR